MFWFDPEKKWKQPEDIRVAKSANFCLGDLLIEVIDSDDDLFWAVCIT